MNKILFLVIVGLMLVGCGTSAPSPDNEALQIEEIDIQTEEPQGEPDTEEIGEDISLVDDTEFISEEDIDIGDLI